MEILASPFADITLQRLPLAKRDPLRAWDAADEYLLMHLDQEDTQARRILVINDQFGALSISLSVGMARTDNQQPEIVSWGDSKLSELAIAHNSAQNSVDYPIHCIASTDRPQGEFDLVIIKVPKVLGLLEHQLITLRDVVQEPTTIIAAGMAKHIHSSTLKTFERCIGKTTTSLAVKKARLIFSHFDQALEPASPYPLVYQEPTLDVELTNHANVFSKEKLDIGARFFIEHFGKLPAADHVIDLGCGNGVLSLMASQHQPKAHFHLIDESYMAIASARSNLAQSELTDEQQHFYNSDCLSQYTGPKADLILCNPPFHQQHTVGDQIAWRMFQQSAKNLTERGELWVVANRHLAYHHKLKRLFKHCRTVVGNNKFVILQAGQHSPN